MKDEETKHGKVVIINTGGTIAMRHDAETDAVSVSLEQPLHHLESLLGQYAVCEMMDLFQIPSPHITLAMLEKLADVVRMKVLDPTVLGVVITHGTDTLEETAMYLDLTVASEKPIVVTGAMRSSNEVGSDGPVNLVESVRVASDGRSRNRGTLVVFNDEIHAARFVTKTHTSNVSTFQSPSGGPIGFVTSRSITYQQPSLQRTTYALVSENAARIPVIKMVVDEDAEWLNWMCDVSLDGVIVEALGSGNVPPPVVPIIRALCNKGIPVVIVSRCYNGYVEDVYGYEGGGKQLRQLGCIFSNGLNGQKARIKLLVLCGAGIPVPDMQTHFEQ